MLVIGPGICFAHGSHIAPQCPKWPACATDPVNPEYVALAAAERLNESKCLDCQKYQKSADIYHGLWKKEAEWVNKLMNENRELQDKLNAADAIIGQHFQAQPDIGMDTPNYVDPEKFYVNSERHGSVYYRGHKTKEWQDAMADAKGLYRPVLDIDVKVQDE